MRWEVSYTVFSPHTGTAFAVVSSVQNLRMILWYQGAYYLHKDSIIETASSGLIVNEKIRDIRVLQVFPFNVGLWADLVLKHRCPGSTEPFIRRCSMSVNCRLAPCPFGATRAGS